jgi:hypothetical protein
MIRNTFIKKFFFNKISDNLVQFYLYKIKVLNENPFERKVTPLDLDETHPSFFHKPYELSGPVMVRTYASSNLVRSNLK